VLAFVLLTILIDTIRFGIIILVIPLIIRELPGAPYFAAALLIISAAALLTRYSRNISQQNVAIATHS